MNASLIHEDWLLSTPMARRLYHEVAAPLPLIDYHCHLDPAAIADDRTFDDLAELWIVGDPYKHRAMRIAGVPEAQITGSASGREKFDRWAQTVPMTLGNPLYAWTALELWRYFGIDEALSTTTAERVWETAKQELNSPDATARGLLRKVNVRCVCTSDRLLDDLSSHEHLAADGSFQTRILPSLRADDLLGVADAKAYRKWLDALGAATATSVRNFDDFRAAVQARLDAFDRLGCRLADHGLDVLQFVATSAETAAGLFDRIAGGESLSEDDVQAMTSGLLQWLGSEYARRGWAMQLHLGAQRTTSSRLRRLAGPTGGYATIGNSVDGPSLCRFLDALERAEALPRTILYPLHPADYAPLATLTGSFAADHAPGLIQLGPAWWYNDHEQGITQQLGALSSYGLLSTFIGMTTDSRSLLSMVRHEYFRRLFCRWIGAGVGRGALPDDASLLDPLVRAVCHDNAATMLNLLENDSR